MTNVEDDIAFIRRTIEDGRAYARGRSPDLLVWGLFVSTGYFATYSFLRGWIAIDPNWIWLVCIGLPWLYSLRGLARRFVGQSDAPARSPMAVAMAMLWLACGVFLTTLAFAVQCYVTVPFHAFAAIVAGVLGIAFFAGSFLCNMPWMRAVAIVWWMGEFVLFGLHDRFENLLLSCALTLVLLAGSGLFLLIGRGRADAA